jgi:hypothetical protein
MACSLRRKCPSTPPIVLGKIRSPPVQLRLYLSPADAEGILAFVQFVVVRQSAPRNIGNALPLAADLIKVNELLIVVNASDNECSGLLRDSYDVAYLGSPGGLLFHAHSFAQLSFQFSSFRGSFPRRTSGNLLSLALSSLAA